MSMTTGQTDGQTDGRQTVTVRFPLDAVSVTTRNRILAVGAAIS